MLPLLFTCSLNEYYGELAFLLSQGAIEIRWGSVTTTLEIGVVTVGMHSHDQREQTYVSTRGWFRTTQISALINNIKSKQTLNGTKIT